MELSGCPIGARMRLELDSKLDGTGLPVPAALLDESCQLTCHVVNAKACTVERQDIKELVL